MKTYRSCKLYRVYHGFQVSAHEPCYPASSLSIFETHISEGKCLQGASPSLGSHFSDGILRVLQYLLAGGWAQCLIEVCFYCQLSLLVSYRGIGEYGAPVRVLR